MINTIPDNFVYFGLFLTYKSKEKLTRFVNEQVLKQMSEITNVYLEHITLFHKNDIHNPHYFNFQMYCLLNYMFENFIGEIYEVKVTHIGFNTKTIAFKVESPDGFPQYKFKTYHITIGTFNDAKPVESNNITIWHQLYEPIIVKTILKKVIHENLRM